MFHVFEVLVNILFCKDRRYLESKWLFIRQRGWNINHKEADNLNLDLYDCNLDVLLFIKAYFCNDI